MHTSQRKRERILQKAILHVLSINISLIDYLHELFQRLKSNSKDVKDHKPEGKFNKFYSAHRPEMALLHFRLPAHLVLSFTPTHIVQTINGPYSQKMKKLGVEDIGWNSFSSNYQTITLLDVIANQANNVYEAFKNRQTTTHMSKMT